MDDYEEDRANDGTPDYRRPEAIDPTELRVGLESLTLFKSDSSLLQQAFNLGLIDGAAMQLETQLLKKQRDEKPFLEESAFLNALSQMWIFAAYELMRTWRQRAGDMIKWAENGGLKMKLDALRRETTFVHFGKEMLARQIESVIAAPALVQKIRLDLLRTYILFAQIEAVRVSIAKHQVRGRPNSVALMPTYGRINMWCGSLDYELSSDSVSMGTISRRNIADGIRYIPQSEAPSDETIKSFDEFMRGPSAEDLAMLFAQPPQQL